MRFSVLDIVAEVEQNVGSYQLYLKFLSEQNVGSYQLYLKCLIQLLDLGIEADFCWNL